MVMIEVSNNNTLMKAFGRPVNCSCLVRNELNGTRAMNEVVHSIPSGLPYMPRPFPLGTWDVGKPFQPNPPDDDLGLWVVPTNAWQMVDVWEVQNGVYTKKTGQQVKDEGYDIHICPLGTSDGCIHLENDTSQTFGVAGGAQGNKQDILDWFVNQVLQFLGDPQFGGVLQIEVS